MADSFINYQHETALNIAPEELKLIAATEHTPEEGV